MDAMDGKIFDLTESAVSAASVLDVLVTLTSPQSRLRLRLPAGEAGRAVAVFDGRSWAAKHYWHEAPAVVVYEFDEPLPMGSLTVRVPLASPPR
jgi:hypothetical protein